MERVDMERSTDIIGRTETKRKWMSSFCKFYGEIKKAVDREKYWDKKRMNGEMKEEWASIKIGAVGYVESKMKVFAMLMANRRAQATARGTT